MISQIWNSLHSPVGVSIIGGLLLISEGLAMTEKFKSNSILQAIHNGLKFLKDKISPKQTP